MSHIGLDQYIDRNSVIHRLDARAKLVFALAFILLVVLSPAGSWVAFSSFLVVISCLIVLTKISPLSLLLRSLTIMPFVLAVAIFVPFFRDGEVIFSSKIWIVHITITRDGILIMGTILFKAFLSILCLVWLTSTTKITNILQAMKRLKFPSLLIMIISFMYRYIFVIVDETLRIKQARDSRNFGSGKLFHIRTLGNIIGVLFIRSYERSERVYSAMLARGYDGTSRTLDNLSWATRDFLFSVTFILLILAITLTNFLGLIR